MTRALVLFDTSVYIPYLRGEAYTGLIEEAVRKGSVRLSSVVLAELYAGTRSAQDKADLDVVLRVYQSLRFLVTPHVMDWIRAGQTLRRYSRLYGKIEPREHMHDILILLGGVAVGAEVVTENAKQFVRWAALLRRMRMAIRVREVRREDYLD